MPVVFEIQVTEKPDGTFTIRPTIRKYRHHSTDREVEAVKKLTQILADGVKEFEASARREMDEQGQAETNRGDTKKISCSHGYISSLCVFCDLEEDTTCTYLNEENLCPNFGKNMEVQDAN